MGTAPRNHCFGVVVFVSGRGSTIRWTLHNLRNGNRPERRLYSWGRYFSPATRKVEHLDSKYGPKRHISPPRCTPRCIRSGGQQRWFHNRYSPTHHRRPWSAPLQIALSLAQVRQEMVVSERTAQVSTDASENLDVVALDREALDNLPVFDQNYVGAISQFLDPGSIATNGVTLVVNGMEQRNIGVSASAVQQVKINQNPYSAEFQRPGRGRIEVITKPSSQVYHGNLNFLFRDYRLNARDPFASVRAPEQRRIYEGSLTGPLAHSKNDSFLFSFNREEEDLQAIVFAYTPAGVIRQNVPNTRRALEFSAGLTHAFTETHVATFRGNYADNAEQNRGVGGITLPEAGTNTQNREDELYFNDSLVITPKLLNQFRIVFGRQHSPTTSVTNAPGIVVPGAFIGGGAQADRLQTENHINLNEIVSWSFGKHDIRTGINIPDISRRGLVDRTNFGGTYSFSTTDDYLAGRPYSLVQQQGDGRVVFVEVVAGGFVQDEYRLRRNLTISAGLRYDWQNFIHDSNNFSPRASFAWAPGESRKTVIRAGAGLFYDRTGPGPLFDLKRYNGVKLRQIVVTDPAYPLAIDVNLGAQPPTVAHWDPTVKMPYTAQFSAGIERQLYKGTTLTATYWATRGMGLFRSRDVNAPPPPVYLTRPNPAIGIYRQIESSGRLQSDSLEISSRPYHKPVQRDDSVHVRTGTERRCRELLRKHTRIWHQQLPCEQLRSFKRVGTRRLRPAAST